jgi:hypothetical protein
LVRQPLVERADRGGIPLKRGLGEGIDLKKGEFPGIGIAFLILRACERPAPPDV